MAALDCVVLAVGYLIVFGVGFVAGRNYERSERKGE